MKTEATVRVEKANGRANEENLSLFLSISLSLSFFSFSQFLYYSTRARRAKDSQHGKSVLIPPPTAHVVFVPKTSCERETNPFDDADRPLSSL